MGFALLLDEMLSGAIAEQLRTRGHDVVAVVEDPTLMGLPDEQILAAATAAGRALVTANIWDFVPLDQRARASAGTHAGIVLVSTRAFPQNRGFVGALVDALDALLEGERPPSDAVVFLARATRDAAPRSQRRRTGR